jgi:four helix bundle protein
MKPTITSFEELECWRAGRELRVFVARVAAPRLPAEERFALRAQMLDAARSVTANIAEGFGRYHYLDNSKFCSNARGSCCEVLDHLITAHDEGFIATETLARGRELAASTVHRLNGYMRYLREAAKREAG